jgi:hypothetical protein
MSRVEEEGWRRRMEEEEIVPTYQIARRRQ